MKLPFVDEAASEFLTAIDFYESERAGLGLEFLDSVERVVAFAEEYPAAGTVVEGLVPGSEFRSFPVERFPYRVVVGRIGERSAVIAIAHGSRAPNYWRAGKR